MGERLYCGVCEVLKYIVLEFVDLEDEDMYSQGVVR